MRAHFYLVFPTYIKFCTKFVVLYLFIAYAVYCVALIQPRGISLVVTHRTADVQVSSDRTVTP